MLLAATVCVLLLVTTTLMHYEALRALNFALPRLPMPARAKVVVLIIGAFASHALEIGLFAGAMAALSHGLGADFGHGHPPDFASLLYFSAETYTSLGYGDIVPNGPLRLLAGSEALTGLLLIGWSTSYVYVAMQRFWQGRDALAPMAAKLAELRPGRRPRLRSSARDAEPQSAPRRGPAGPRRPTARTRH